MHIIRKLLILVILIITIYITYSLFQKNAEIKKQIAQEIKKTELEGFDHKMIVTEGYDNKMIVAEGYSELSAATDMSKLNDDAAAMGRGLNIKPISKQYYKFPLKEFMVKSSYNSAIVGQSASENAIKFVIKRGCRLLDFEIYTRTNDDGITKEYISFSEDVKNESLKTDLDLTMDKAFETVIGNAFTSAPAPKDPLFIHLRIQTNSRDAYRRISKSISTNFGSKLYRKEVNSETPIGELMDKVVMILDVETAPDYDKYGNCGNIPNCVPIINVINLRSGMKGLPKYSYVNYNSIVSMPTSYSDDGLTDITMFFMMTPPQIGNVNPPSIADLAKNPCQMVLIKYYNQTPILKEYEEIFNMCESSFCPMSVFIKEMRK